MNESWRHSRHRDAALPSRASLAFSFQHLGKNSYKICSKDTTEGGAVCLIWGTANNMDKKFRFKLFRWLSVYFGQYFTCPSICLGRHIYEIRYCLLGRNFNISILSLTEVKMLTQRKISIVFLMPCSFPQRHDYSCTSDHRTKNLPGPFRMENCCTQTCCIQILCSARERWILLLWVLCFDFKWVLVPFSQIHNERSSNTAHYHTYIPTFKQLTVIIFFIHNPARRA